MRSKQTQAVKIEADTNVGLDEKVDKIISMLENIRSMPSKDGNIIITDNSDLKFSDKEVKKMPVLKDCKIRRKKNGVYEIRYRKNGYNMSFSSKTLDDAKQKCLEWLSTLNDLITANKHFVIVPRKDYKPKKNTNFGVFAKSFMVNVKKRTIKPITFKTYMYSFNSHILPKYGSMNVEDIKPTFIQQHLNVLSEEAPRVCEDVKNMLRAIFEYAVNNDIISKNPMNAVFIPKHERTTGQALTYAEEKDFLEKIKGNRYENYFLFMLYSGCRVCEYNTVRVNDDDTITIKNAKLKSYQKVKERVLPVFPMLRPYLSGINTSLKGESASDAFSKIMPNHTLKDLRHTFTTRARECGIDNEVVAIWTGHSLGNVTSSVYTHFSIEFMRKQAEKLRYEI